MNNLTEESGLGDCLICQSKIENYDVLAGVAGEESKKIVGNCWNYLHEKIANSKLQNVKSENEDEPPLCKKCFDAVSELMPLSEQGIQIQKKISDLSFEFSLGVLARRTQVESAKNVSDGQNSPKELIVLDVSGISPSLISTDQPNPTEMDDFAHPCEDNFSGMDVAGDPPQYIFEFIKHESKEDVDEESSESEDDTNTIDDEELQAETRPMVFLKGLNEANFSEKINSKSSRQQSPSNPSCLKHRLRNGASKKKVEQPSSSNFIREKTGSGNLKKETKSVSSVKLRGRIDKVEKKEHKCHLCGKVFAGASNLRTHIRVHTGEKPFKCQFCGKAFTQMGAVKTHERIHTGEKPFKCSICMKAFVTSSCVRKHERIHTRVTRETPFECLHCKKTFAQLNSLKRHLRVHT